MLERIDGWWDHESSKFDRTRPMWRVFSAKIHGPVMFTRRGAFIAWALNRFTNYKGGYSFFWNSLPSFLFRPPFYRCYKRK